MKTTIVMLESLDAKIAKTTDDDLSWGSSTDKNFYRGIASSVDVVIMGSSTFNNMPEVAFRNKFTLVFTTEPKKYSGINIKDAKIEFFSGTPGEALEMLETRGLETALLSGGANMYSQFLNAKLVDDIWVTISPNIFGRGIDSFGSDELNVKLKLESHELITENEILLHYLVDNSE
jgi:dihydrofolate reductase